MLNISEFASKIKSALLAVRYELLMLVIVILTSFASFLLGRLSALEEKRPPARIINNVAVEKVAEPTQIKSGVVASRKGKTYHFPWCAGANTIGENNKVWYKDEESAKKVGLSPARNCKGLR